MSTHQNIVSIAANKRPTSADFTRTRMFSNVDGKRLDPKVKTIKTLINLIIHWLVLFSKRNYPKQPFEFFKYNLQTLGWLCRHYLHGRESTRGGRVHRLSSPHTQLGRVRLLFRRHASASKLSPLHARLPEHEHSTQSRSQRRLSARVESSKFHLEHPARSRTHRRRRLPSWPKSLPTKLSIQEHFRMFMYLRINKFFVLAKKGAIVELFGWPFSEIAEECELLGRAGYLGVKLSPVHEHIMSNEPENGALNPWYYIYQPISYKFSSRFGSWDDLTNLIRTCRSHGVRVYVDIVLNHLTGPVGSSVGQDDSNHSKPARMRSSASLDRQSPFFTHEHSPSGRVNPYTNQLASYEYPGAGFGPEDFHCERPIDKWDDLDSLNNGWLAGHFYSPSC